MVMTVNQMIILSHICLGLALFFMAAAVSSFFLLDIRRAWRILHQKGLSFQRSEKQQEKKSCKEQEIILDITYIDTKIRL